MSEPKLAALHTYLQQNVAKGFSHEYTSPAGVPVLFVKDGTPQLCEVYRALNQVAIRN